MSHIDTAQLLTTLNAHYKLDIQSLTLHRDMIGYVYFVDSTDHRYVLKLYRPMHTPQAMQSIEIIQYLSQHDYPVVSIVPTYEGRMHITVGESVGILYHFIDGAEPDVGTLLEDIGAQVGHLHNLMQDYPHTLISRDQSFYIDRYIKILRQLNYAPAKIDDLEQYGADLWSNIQQSQRGFCHGDLHSGNMRLIDGRFILFDFDIASMAHPIIDIATLSDGTNFNRLDSDAYDHTLRRLERFYKGYGEHRTIHDRDTQAILSFIAARHYELIATISECQGIDDLSLAFLDQQYGWLMEWRDVCIKRFSS